MLLTPVAAIGAQFYESIEYTSCHRVGLQLPIPAHSITSASNITLSFIYKTGTLVPKSKFQQHVIWN